MLNVHVYVTFHCVYMCIILNVYVYIIFHRAFSRIVIILLYKYGVIYRNKSLH